ncbi:MAG: bifunctional class I SAM-dependent methyltransferase/NUDIX hydrolase [Longimicrobiaceae bacterium]
MDGGAGEGGYRKQHRGGAAAYEAYFAGMDASVQQKIALTTAHFPARGRIADMGSGSGRGTYDLACLHHGLELVGVDINPVSVRISERRYRRPNLSYVVGDIAGKVFPDESLDGILDSSVLHHVSSFNGFDVGRVLAALDHQVAQLRTGGVIIVRDFVVPEGPERVHLDLPLADGRAEGAVAGLSTAALFERFARDWRSSLCRAGPLPYERLESPREGFARYRVASRAAAEFVLRKDYRADWETELLEEYTYLSRDEFEAAFRARGLRVVVSAPIWNPWIVANRFEERFHLSDLDGRALPPPPTNYLIVGEKVRPGGGVELVETEARERSTPEFLGLTFHRERRTGEVMELVERPDLTLDLVPWFEEEGQLFVYAKKGFPRPVANACAEQHRPSRSAISGYITEPLSAIVPPGEAPDAAALRILAERAGFPPGQVVRLGEPFHYFTSPGGVNERVAARLVQVHPRAADAPPFPNYTDFREAGTVRELDAAQVLRACHVGGMFDARLEISVYRLLREQGRSPGPWIGAALDLELQAPGPAFAASASALVPGRRLAFDAPSAAGTPDFLSVREGRFAERDGAGSVLAKVPFEYVAPRRLSVNTLVALPVARTADGVFVGVEHRDLPAPQHFTGSSALAAAPAWRLARTVAHRWELGPLAAEGVARDFGLRVRRWWELGGAYLATPGVTPETLYPFVAEVELAGAADSPLRFIHVDEIAAKLGAIESANLLIAVNRLLHALGRQADGGSP